MILPLLATALPLSSLLTASKGQPESASQNAAVRTIADAVAILKANIDNGPTPAASPAPPNSSQEDVEALRPLDMQTWVSNDDYPVAAIRAGAAGTVTFKLSVSEAGRVTDCRIVSSSGSAVLDQTTCDLMRTRARFSPARVKGKPVPATYQTRFRWELPASPPPWDMEKPITAHLRFDVASDGGLSNCVLEAEGAPKPAPPLCPSLEKAPAPLLDYFRGGSKTSVTIAADFTVALQGAAADPVQTPTPGVVTFAHLSFQAEPNGAGRPHCMMEGAWGDYKGRLDFPCPRDLERAIATKTQVFRMAMTLGSSGPAPDPEGLGPIIKLIMADEHPRSPDEAAPAASGTRNALRQDLKRRRGQVRAHQ